MNIKTRPILSAILYGYALLCCAPEVYAASIVTNVAIDVLSPISITQTTAMNLGRVMRPTGGTPSAVTLSTAGVRSISGGNGALVSGGTINAASYKIFGSSTYLVNLSVTSITNPGTGLTLSNFFGKFNAGSDTNIDSGAGGQATLTTLAESTGDVLNVGAKLTLTSSSIAGSYTGNYTLNVDYP